jgi:DNA-binding beta-propeller fold protein YncE
MKKLLTLLFMVALFASTANAQWTSQGDFWPDSIYTGGTHGIAVDPDGKVWVSSYFKDVPFGPDSISTSGILVFNPDGTPASFSPICTVATGGGFVVDTLNGHCRGLGVMPDGNIIYVQSTTNKMFKIDYKTGEGIARHDLTELKDGGMSPTAPGIAADGTIFVGPVVGGTGTQIAMYDADLNYVASAVDAPPAIARTLEVSSDGLTLYWMPFTAHKVYVYKRNDEFSPFNMADSILEDWSVESSAWNPATGKLWVSNDPRGDTSLTGPIWAEFDAETNQLTGVQFAWDNPVDGEYARGIDFSPDGKIAYVGTFSTGTARIRKYVNEGTDVKELGTGVPSEFNLSQNYPNPFNPTTVINFSIPESGLVTLKVYNTLGQEVAELVNAVKAAGNYEVNFDASQLATGMYIYKIQAGNFTATKKMMLLK